MLALLGAVAVSAAAPADCRATLCYPESLAPFFAKLGPGKPVHIVQIGDSHTAGDTITRGWRGRLQARYGNGGRGVLPAGRPYAGYLTSGVTAWQSGGWLVNATLGESYRSNGPPLGLAGFTQSALFAETLGVTADTPDQAFDRLIVCAFAQSGGGTLVLRIGDMQQQWRLDAPACRTLESDMPVSSASVASEGAVSITSFATFRREGGIVLSNLGVSGAQLAHLGRADDDVIRAELAAYRPDLIVLAFGTNEGFSVSLTADSYEAALRGQIARLRGLAGENVPILLLGAPEAAARRPGEACGGGWSVPRLLGAVRERQRIVARDMGLAYWDWSAAMGGPCAAVRWRRAGLIRGDHVHFTRAGGERIGEMIDDDLSAAAQAASGH